MPDAAASVEVAKGVTARLASASLSQRFEPERSYADWELELQDYDCLHVDVVAVMTEQTVEMSARGPVGGSRLQYTIPVDIGVRKRFGQERQDDDTGRVEIGHVDALVLLIEEINELFQKHRLADFPSGVHQETKIIANPVKKHLHEHRQFTGIVRVTFKVDRIKAA